MNVRSLYLDALKGLLALIIFAEHFLKIYFPSASIYEVTFSELSFQTLLSVLSPASLLYNGKFAVAGFFVVSGYLLTQSANSTIDRGVSFHLGKLFQRYLRFSLPLLCCLALIYAFAPFISDKISNKSIEYGAAHLFTSPGSALEVITQSFYSSMFLFNSQHNPVLWILSYEMWAVVVIAASSIFVSLLSKRYKKAGMALALAATVFFIYDTIAISIWIGAAVYYLQEYVVCKLKLPLFRVISLFTAVMILLITLRGGENNPFNIEWAFQHSSEKLYTAFALSWALLLLNVLTSLKLQNWFAYTQLHHVGRVGYGFYIFHYPMLSISFVLADQKLVGSWEREATLTCCLALILTTVLAKVSLRAIERPLEGWSLGTKQDTLIHTAATQ